MKYSKLSIKMLKNEWSDVVSDLNFTTLIVLSLDFFSSYLCDLI